MRIKRLVSLLLITLLLCCPQLIQASAFEVGDYVVMGEYNGEPILWRILRDKGDGNLELISDKIITLKAFDGRHADGTDIQKSGGSGRWSDSNLQNWLNSVDAEVDFTCGNAPDTDAVTTNPYDTETGFMNNFSEAEKSYVTKGSNNSILNALNIAYATAGGAELLYNREPDGVSTNVSSAYYETVFDYFYLPSVADIEYIRNNIPIFGVDYHKAFPTERAIETSDMQYKNITADNAWYYWLRDSMYGNKESFVRCVTPTNTVEYAQADNGIVGVRPMCTIDVSKAGVASGDGTIGSPYVLDDVPWIYINGNTECVMYGSKVTVNVHKINAPSDANIIVTHNGKVVLANPTEAFTVTPVEGVNVIGAEMVDGDGNLITSSTFKVRCIQLDIPSDNVFIDDNFNNSSDLSDYVPANTSSSNVTYEYKTENGDSYLSISSKGGTIANISSGSWANKYHSSADATYAEMDIRFTAAGYNNMNFLSYKVWANSKSSFIYPLKFYKNGNLNVADVEGGERTVATLELGVWYNIKAILSNSQDTFTVVLTDSREPDTHKIICNNIKLAAAVDYTDFTLIRSYGKPNTTTIDVSYWKVADCTVLGSTDSMIGSMTLDSNNKLVRLLMNNTTDEKLQANLVFAQYNSDKNLKGSKMVKATIDEGMSDLYTISFDEPVATGDTVKLFLFSDISTLKPLMEPKTLGSESGGEEPSEPTEPEEPDEGEEEETENYVAVYENSLETYSQISGSGWTLKNRGNTYDTDNGYLEITSDSYSNYYVEAAKSSGGITGQIKAECEFMTTDTGGNFDIKCYNSSGISYGSSNYLIKGGKIAGTSTAIQAGKWYKMAVKIDTSTKTFTMYVNGKKVGSAKLSNATNLKRALFEYWVSDTSETNTMSFRNLKISTVQE